MKTLHAPTRTAKTAFIGRLVIERVAAGLRTPAMRWALGVSQMVGAILTLTLLVAEGPSCSVLVLAAATSTLTMVSRTLFPRRGWFDEAEHR